MPGVVGSKSTVGRTCRCILSQLVNDVNHSITQVCASDPLPWCRSLTSEPTMILMAEDHCPPITISDVCAFKNSFKTFNFKQISKLVVYHSNSSSHFR